ncbi:MAG: hypothetical protein PHE79_09660 [Eubacteriales bacterium]|nr:hypothetical protein [Eubacteriales bacterium]
MMKEQIVIEKMKETIGYMRDAKKNSDGFYTEQEIFNNMSQYFTGLAFALETITGKEYHWSRRYEGEFGSDRKEIWSLVIYNNGKEKYIPIQPDEVRQWESDEITGITIEK